MLKIQTRPSAALKTTKKPPSGNSLIKTPPHIGVGRSRQPGPGGYEGFFFQNYFI